MCNIKKNVFLYSSLFVIFWKYTIVCSAPDDLHRENYTIVTVMSSTIISRMKWDARAPISTRRLAFNPPPFAVIHHSATDSCYTDEVCKKRIKSIQNYHMDHNKWEDIGYNFLIGGNGEIFEGRGWGIHGAHAPVFNRRSIGICLLGNFGNRTPSDEQLQATQELIAFGVNNSFIMENYTLVGHRQGSHTECPGQKLFDEITKWPHYDPTKYNIDINKKLII